MPNSLKHVLCLLLFSNFYLHTIHAQGITRVVSGIVTDEKNNLLPGATISAIGATAKEVTDKDGRYRMTIPVSVKKLSVSFIGMLTQEIDLNKSNSYNVTIGSVSTTLGEVVIGYGTTKKKDVTSAISSVNFNDVKSIPQPSVDQLLQGKVAGVQVTQNSGQPGSSTSLRIRGITSLGNSEPLYVIDGVAISGSSSGIADNSGGRGSASFASRGGSGGQTAMSPLATLNPADIVSVDVLKDASAQAIYGNRAANGVVIITTKKGKSGDAKITYDGFVGTQTLRKPLDLLNLQQFAQFSNRILSTGVGAPALRPEFADPTLLGAGTDWQKALTRTAGQQNHNLSVSGGKDQTTYFFSGGITNQDGIIQGSKFNRYNFRMNIDTRVKSFLKMGISVNAANTKERVVLADALDGVIGQAVQLSPNVPVYGFDGKFSTPTAEQVGQGAPTGNPLAEALMVRNSLERNKLFGNVYAEISLLKNLSFRADVSGDFNFGQSDFYVPTRGFGFSPNNLPYISTGKDKTFWWNASQTLNYNKTFGSNHNINILVGHEANESKWEWFGGQRVGNETGIPFIASFNQVGQGINAGRGAASLESYFGRAAYTFKNRYILSGTLRRDGSSKFDPLGKNVWGNFYGVSAAWKVSEEEFMKNVGWLTNVKIRGGYGEVGNQNIPAYQFTVPLIAGGTSDVLQLQQGNFKNSKLRWETAVQTNVGVEFTLFKNFDFIVDYFNKGSREFLLRVPYPEYLGSFDYFANQGNMSNKGIEFSMSSRNIKTDHFSWTTNFNITKINNEVKGLTAPIINEPNIADQDVKAILITQNGGSISQFYGYKVKDIFRTEDQVTKAPTQFGLVPNANGTTYWIGDTQYEDINADGVINEKDKTIIGNPIPKFTAGLTNNFSYKGFDLSIFLTATFGNDAFNILRYRTESMFSADRNQTTGTLDYFDVVDLNNPRNATTMTPKPRFGAANNFNIIPTSSRWVEDASFIRIQNISLAYNLPYSIIKRAKLSKFRVFISAQNLHVFTNYKGLDPEIGSFNQSPLVTGVDVGRYPAPRVITFGANLEF